ncbi:helix-turn-helix domain-containing protein [Pseudonocardia sp. NPDC049154]|uniref:TetR/AcrR family transcriptional regulator n=1 Tax=Pseudonocardia sp. NPDC049154 TaxID=3155501 RepID=UPI0033C2EE15
MNPGLPVPSSTADADEDLVTRRRRLMKDDIARVAVQLFLAHGYEAVSVDDIAAAAKMSQRSFFRYFATKEEALTRYWHRMNADLVTAYRDRPPSEDPAEALRAALMATSHVPVANRPVALALGRLFLDTPNVWARMVGDSFLDPSVGDEWARRAGATAGDLAPWVRASATVTAATMGWMAWVRSGGVDDAADFVARALDALT